MEVRYRATYSSKHVLTQPALGSSGLCERFVMGGRIVGLRACQSLSTGVKFAYHLRAE